MENINLTAKLKLDTKEAESQLQGLEGKARKATDGAVAVSKEATSAISQVFKGEGGLKNIADIAQGATRGINGLMSSVQRLARSSASLTGAMAGVAGAVAVLYKLFQGTDTLERVSTEFKVLFELAQKALAPAIASIGELLIALAEAIRPLLAILTPLAEYVKTLTTPFIGLLQALQPITKLVGKVIELNNSMYSIVSSVFTGAIESVIITLVELVEVGIKPFLEILQPVIDFFNELRKVIEDFITSITFGLVKFGKPLASTTGNRKELMKSSLDTWETSGEETALEKSARLALEASEASAEASKQAKDNLKTFDSSISIFGNTFDGKFGKFIGELDILGVNFGDIGTRLAFIGGTLKENAQGFATTVKDTMVLFGKTVGDKVSSLARSLSEGVTSLTRTFGEKVTDFATAVKEGVTSLTRTFGERVTDFATALKEGVSSLTKTFGEKVVDIATQLGEGIKSLPEKIKEATADIGTKIGQAYDKVKDVATTGAKAVAEGAKELAGKATQKATEVVSTATKVASSVANVAKTGIEKVVEKVQPVIDTVGTVAKNVASKVGGVFSKAWSGLKGLFKMEDGGTVAGAQVWGMNEKGNPEFLFNAGGHDTVINADILADAVAEGMSRAPQHTGKIEVGIKAGAPAGPRELAQWLLPSLQFMLR